MANIVPRNTTGHGRGGEIAAQSVPLAAFFQPLRPSGHLPYILLCKTQRRSFKISSIVKIEIPRKATGHGREEAKMCFEDFSIEEMN